MRREAPCAALLGAGVPAVKAGKGRGNRRYYQRADVEMIRTIRSLLYEQGYTIGGARQRMVQEKEALRPGGATGRQGLHRGSAQGPAILNPPA